MRVLFGEGGQEEAWMRVGALLPKKEIKLFFSLQRTKGGPESAKFVKEAEKVQKRSIKEPGNAL